MLVHLLSFFVALLAIAFLTLCLASGLLYLAELIEENSLQARRIARIIIQLIIACHLAFYFSDGFPLRLVALGISAHLIYLTALNHPLWPAIPLDSMAFIASCSIVVIDHFAWFFYFVNHITSSNYHHHLISPLSHPPHHPQLSFWDMTTFFALCVWLVPFFIFLSLSASDYVLPNSISPVTNLTDLPALSAQPPTPTTDSYQDVVYDAKRLALDPSAVCLDPAAPHRHQHSFLKSVLQSCLSSLPNFSLSTKSGRTSSRPNQGLISPSRPNSPSLPHLLAQPKRHLSSSSPPPSPRLLYCNQLSPSSVTTSPRRAFSSPMADSFTIGNQSAKSPTATHHPSHFNTLPATPPPTSVPSFPSPT